MTKEHTCKGSREKNWLKYRFLLDFYIYFMKLGATMMNTVVTICTLWNLNYVCLGRCYLHADTWKLFHPNSTLMKISEWIKSSKSSFNFEHVRHEYFTYVQLSPLLKRTLISEGPEFKAVRLQLGHCFFLLNRAFIRSFLTMCSRSSQTFWQRLHEHKKAKSKASL